MLIADHVKLFWRHKEGIEFASAVGDEFAVFIGIGTIAKGGEKLDDAFGRSLNEEDRCVALEGFFSSL